MRKPTTLLLACAYPRFPCPPTKPVAQPARKVSEFLGNSGSFVRKAELLQRRSVSKSRSRWGSGFSASWPSFPSRPFRRLQQFSQSPQRLNADRMGVPDRLLT